MIGDIKLTGCKNHHFFSLITYFSLLILLISFKLEGQYRFDFEIDSSTGQVCCPAGQWEQYPEERWCCDSLEPIAGSFSLHHCFDNPGAGCDYLVFRHDPLSWSEAFSLSFRVRHGYDPSSQNNWQLALCAAFGDEGGEPQIVSGLVLGVNYKGSDDLVKVWGVEEGEIQEWCAGSLNYQEQVGTVLSPLFVLEWDGSSELSLFCSTDPHVQDPELIASCTPAGLPGGRDLVLRYRYTSERDRALWMDSLILDGKFERDTLPPVLSRVELMGGQSIRLEFSERVRNLLPAMFILYGEDNPGGVCPDSVGMSEQAVLLFFSGQIPNRLPCQLHISGVEDLEGNFLADTLLSLMRNEAVWGDLVFSELMFDPDPPVAFDEEYLELYNRSNYLLNLENWQLKVNERDHLLDSYLASTELEPGDFALVRGITLPNEGAVLSLYSAERILIHAASYRLPWDAASWKKDGGWSLESPDVNQLCALVENWKFSTDPSGGTPGEPNSHRIVLADVQGPVLLFAGLSDPGGCLLHYSEPVGMTEMQEEEIILDPGGVVPQRVDVIEPLSMEVELHFPEDFTKWDAFGLTLPGLSDCAGNVSPEEIYKGGRPSEALFGSVILNEIMYDPEEGDPEYIELYLPGEKFYDLQDLAIHLVDEGKGPDNPVTLSRCSRLFLPGQYLVLTKCVAHLIDAHGLEMSGCWVEVEELPALKNSSGCIYLTDRAGNVVDMAVYRDEMHMELLDDPRGISLERIAWDRPGSDPDNWHSTASIEGYATPGRKNSQSPGEKNGQGLLSVEPEVFSPDNDGYGDLLEIVIRTGGQDWVVGLWITDLHGNMIRELANNHIAGPVVSYSWDGEGENGSMQSMGFYVVHLSAYNPATGERRVRRKAIGLVYR